VKEQIKGKEVFFVLLIYALVFITNNGFERGKKINTPLKKS